ncbi:MAG: hypothetical protein ACI9O0_000367 [Paracoccaceae bacterium]|jgi:hypothetical protein
MVCPLKPDHKNLELIRGFIKNTTHGETQKKSWWT